ncbi:MAG: hypothetical protein EI684_04740 [Candidatus Viridilinea halotolerans]|uniref:Uncharacterized protein n=1 Tax=Candidatus Viridilinea halotolerans TaxID=2491704 RepID=A0A426U614_9CHLR|nr:MAG: hypothetical protein EI684_04740 [Candidatus Viridilinea halotolerans]
MSEYQYYEFQTIDGLLSAAQQAELRKISKRVELSASRAAFNYAYGDFPRTPLKVLEDYFDAMLYIANWGTKQFALRLPKGAVNAEQLQPYLLGDEEGFVSTLQATPEYLLLNFEWHEEGGFGWIEGEGMLGPLLPLRDAIMRGDRRALYLFWLCCANQSAAWSEPEDLVEPPVPPGLGQLDAALQAFIEFFAIDQDLIAAAATASPELKVQQEPLAAWVPLLPEAERNAFLVDVACGATHVGPRLLQRLREVGGAQGPVATTTSRTFADIQADVAQIRELRLQRERAAAEQERRAKQTAAEQSRRAKLEALAQREDAAWARIPALLATRTASGYQEGVALLADLRDLAVQHGQRAAFDAKLAPIIAPYATSAALQRRLRQHSLV